LGGNGKNREGEPGEHGRFPEFDFSGDSIGEGALAGEGIEATRRLLTRLSGQIRQQMIDPGMLRDLGWQPGTLRMFVTKYEEALGELKPQEYEDELSLEAQFGQRSVLRGKRSADSLGAADTLDVELKKEVGEASRAFVEEEVSAPYREMVNEYHKALAGGSDEEAQ